MIESPKSQFLSLHISAIRPGAPRLFLPGKVSSPSLQFPASFFVDSGADACFMNAVLAVKWGIPLVSLDIPAKLVMADGSKNRSIITHKTIPLTVRFGAHVEQLEFYIASIAHKCILGYDWLLKNNPDIDWVSRKVCMRRPSCCTECSEGKSCIQGDSKIQVLPEPIPEGETALPDPTPQNAPECIQDVIEDINQSQPNIPEVPPDSLEDPQMNVPEPDQESYYDNIDFGCSSSTDDYERYLMEDP